MDVATRDRPDWTGTALTRDAALYTATEDLMRFARIGRAYDVGGAVEANKLASRF